MPEQKIVETTRKLLVNEKGYPDPANCEKPDSNNLIMYAQDDYKDKNKELFNTKTKRGLLAHSSKCADKSVQDKIWTDEVVEGKPEFIVINTNTNLAIVIECKAAQQTNNHISPYLRDENILIGRGDIISKYAVDGALHYAKFLSKEYDVIAIGVSGIPHSDKLEISTFYWEKNKDVFFDEKELQKKVTDKTTGKKTTVITKLPYCYGPFVNLKINSLQSYAWYQNFLSTQSKKVIREFNEEKALSAAAELNVILDGAAVNATVRALLVSGLLLALRDKTFQKTYKDKEILASDISLNLSLAIERVVDNEDIEDDFKKKVLKDIFKSAFNQQALLDENARGIREVLSRLHKTVYPCMDGNYYSVDIIGKFYHEFLSYAPNSENNGIKLTPSQITNLFCELVDLKITDTVIDPCLGTGGFLISAMNKLYRMADKMTEDQIDTFFAEKLASGDVTQKQINRMKSVNLGLHGTSCLTIKDVKKFIRKNQLVGCEADNNMYTLGCSNMILRGDGKSNILLNDCFRREKELKEFGARIGFMNPPYSGSAYTVMEFVELLCRCVKKDGYAVVIAPTSAVHSDEFIANKNRILQNNTLIGVMSMSIDLFRGIADIVTCIMIFKIGTPHDFNKNVYFGNWKDDGYYWHKTRGMIPDYEHRYYKKTPDEYVQDWIASFKNDDHSDDEYGIWRKLSIDVNGICNDEWLWEYFVETDYSKLTQKDFEKTIKNFALFKLQNPAHPVLDTEAGKDDFEGEH